MVRKIELMAINNAETGEPAPETVRQAAQQAEQVARLVAALAYLRKARLNLANESE
jgi:hypothetical protein